MILIIDSSVIGCGLMLVVEIKHGVVHLLSLMPLRIDMINSILSLTILIVALRNKLCMVLRIFIVIIVILINVVIGILIIIGCGLVISILVLIVYFLSEIA